MQLLRKVKPVKKFVTLIFFPQFDKNCVDIYIKVAPKRNV